MRKRNLVMLAGVLAAATGAAAFATLAIPTEEASAVSDPRQEPPIVRLVTPAQVSASERGFTGAGVWVLDRASSTVKFRPVKLVRVSSETAVISGLNSADPIVSLGAHLLQEGARVRIAVESGTNS